MDGYEDVFISHKQQDHVAAERLKATVEALGYSCYLDVADPGLAATVSTVELAERIRNNLRRARCLIYLRSSRSHESRWMPWELGFFDGRWGAKTVGLYLVGGVEAQPDPKAKAARPADAAHEAQALSVQEYLAMYEAVTDANLPAFLQRATSLSSLSNRNEVDVDRFMTLAAGAARNPVAFQLGCMQYLLGTLRPMAAANPISQLQLDSSLAALGVMRQAAERMAPVANLPDGNGAMDVFEPFLKLVRDSQAQGAVESAAPPKFRWPS